MSMKQNDILLEQQAELIDPFDADQCNSIKGRELRESITIQDLHLLNPLQPMDDLDKD